MDIKELFKKIKLPFQISLSGVSLFWVIYVLRDIDWGVSRSLFKHLSISLLAACLFLFGLIYITRSIRLYCWVKAMSGRKVSLKEWSGMYLKSIAFGSVTPARLGDFSRIPLLKSTGLDLIQRTRVIFQDKLSDFLYIPLGICLTSGIVGEKLDVSGEWIFFGGLALLVVYGLVFYWIGRFLKAKTILAGWFIAIAGLCLFIPANTFLFWSAGIQLSMLDVAAITLSAGFVANLPLSVGGIGIRESSLIYLLCLWGVEPDATPPVLILEFIANMVFPVALFLGWYICTNMGRFFSRLQNGHRTN